MKIPSLPFIATSWWQHHVRTNITSFCMWAHDFEHEPVVSHASPWLRTWACCSACSPWLRTKAPTVQYTLQYIYGKYCIYIRICIRLSRNCPCTVNIQYTVVVYGSRDQGKYSPISTNFQEGSRWVSPRWKLPTFRALYTMNICPESKISEPEPDERWPTHTTVGQKLGQLQDFPQIRKDIRKNGFYL